MKPRIVYAQASPAALEGMFKLEKHLAHCAVERSLLDLVKLRVSQINGCAYCIDMHWKDLRAAGETEQRLYGLDAWRESPYYSERERAALAWAEAVTRVTDGHVPDAIFAAAQAQFSDTELVDLTLGVTTINAWNRIAIAFRSEAGTYQVPVALRHREAAGS